MSKPQPVRAHKADVPSIAGTRPEFRDADHSPLYDVMDQARRDYLRAVHAWLVHARPPAEAVQEEASAMANAFVQINTVAGGGPRHG